METNVETNNGKFAYGNEESFMVKLVDVDDIFRIQNN